MLQMQKNISRAQLKPPRFYIFMVELYLIKSINKTNSHQDGLTFSTNYLSPLNSLGDEIENCISHNSF